MNPTPKLVSRIGAVSNNDPASTTDAEARLRALMDAVPDCIVRAAPDGTILDINSAAAALLEAESKDEVVGKSFYSFIASGNLDGGLSIAEAISPDNKRPFELVLVTGKGKRRQVEAFFAKLPPKSGDQTGETIVYARDVTELRLLERERSAVTSIVGSGNDAIVGVSSDFTITSWNTAAEELFGFTASEALGQKIGTFVPPSSHEHVHSTVRKVIASGSVERYEARQQKKNGEWLQTQVSICAANDAAGNRIGVTAIIRDITAQRRLEAYTRGLIESSIDAMVAVDRELIITDVNEQMARLTEIPKKILIGSRFDSYFIDAERAAEVVRKALSDGFVANHDLLLQPPNGNEIMVSLNASILPDAVGNVSGVFVVARDVTERRQMEKTLREQQDYTRGLIEASIDSLVVTDPAFNIVDINEQTVRATGYSRERLIGISFPALFTDPARAEEALRKTLTDGFVRDLELTLRLSNGGELQVSFNAAALKDTAGRVRGGIFAAARDITERQRLEKERSQLVSIIESSDDAIYSETRDTIVTSWNTGAEKLYGYGAGEMIGRSITVCVPVERRVEMAEHLAKVFSDRCIQQFETQRLGKDGSLMDVSITMSPIRDTAGVVVAMAVVARDIAERKRFERELTEARDTALAATRLKSDFLASMSHEIRTPLNSIIGMTGLLLDTPMTAEQREFTRDAYESGQGLLTVINDILDFSKMAAGRIAFEEIDFELRDVVEGAVNPLADEARKKGLELIVAIEPDAPRLLRGDPVRLRQVLINLVGNAVKFTERGDVVVRASKITESPTEATLHMEVQDTGIGIAKEDQHRLFHPFTQTDASIHRKHGGTGLGLAISQQLVHQMGGKISILSAPGVGSTFWFTAKFKKQPQEAGAPPEPVTELRGMRALVVDDNPKNREILCEQLASWGMAADAAPDGEAALANLRAAVRDGRPYAVVLLDMQMPEVDGVHLARRIRSEPAIAKACLLMLSATEKPLDYDNLVAGLNIATCLIKPVRMLELYDSLRRALSGEPPAQPEDRATGLAGALVPTPKFEHLHILVAEDNAVNQKVAVRQLRKLGCVADAVVNGHEAVEAATQTPYDLILMDCEMPQMDGYDATREIRQHEGSGRHTRIVAMTAHALSGDREKCLAAGMDDYISKPVRIEALAEVISRMVAVPDPAPAVASVPAVQNLEDGLRTAPGGREKRTS